MGSRYNLRLPGTILTLTKKKGPIGAPRITTTNNEQIL